MTRGALTILGTACALAIAACTRVGPDFEEPKAEVNPTWELFESKRVEARAPRSEEWWHAFDDPVLNELVERAYVQNLSLEAAGLRVLEARAQLGIAVGQLYPQQQAATGGAIYNDSNDRGSTTVGGDSSYWRYDLGLTVGWELDFWGRFRRGIEAADANLLASIAAYDSVLVLLIAQVVDTYVVIPDGRTATRNRARKRQAAKTPATKSPIRCTATANSPSSTGNRP